MEEKREAMIAIDDRNRVGLLGVLVLVDDDPALPVFFRIGRGGAIILVLVLAPDELPVFLQLDVLAFSQLSLLRVDLLEAAFLVAFGIISNAYPDSCALSVILLVSNGLMFLARISRLQKVLARSDVALSCIVMAPGLLCFSPLSVVSLTDRSVIRDTDTLVARLCLISCNNISPSLFAPVNIFFTSRL